MNWNLMLALWGRNPWSDHAFQSKGLRWKNCFQTSVFFNCINVLLMRFCLCVVKDALRSFYDAHRWGCYLFQKITLFYYLHLPSGEIMLDVVDNQLKILKSVWVIQQGMLLNLFFFFLWHICSIGVWVAFNSGRANTENTFCQHYNWDIVQRHLSRL